jgi:N-acetylglucosaminyl-diphospho-decaprenol L-rhamnosyltransferase
MSRVTVSIVSHGHSALVGRALRQMLACPDVARVILTLNVPEAVSLPSDDRLLLIRNASPKGFGANHNAAFKYCQTAYFAVVNPDIELTADPFPTLVAALEHSEAVVAGPLVRARAGEIEDSIRPFPTVTGLAIRWWRGAPETDSPCESDVNSGGVFTVDWVAGMFMLFDSGRFARLGGFDEGFHLYCEDVDICVRAWRDGGRVLAVLGTVVVHDARRDSRSKPRFLAWHVRSMLRYFAKHFARLPRSVAWIRVDR